MSDETQMPTQTLSATIPDEVQSLINLGAKRKYLTYDDLNETLPDNWVEPDRVDELLVHADELGIRMVESRQVKPKTVEFEEDDKPAPDTGDSPKDIAAALQEALNEAGARRIDDPVRMYLTQMGEISLLTRAEEIRLAKKIELCRMIFRRKLLQNDYAIQQAVDILELVRTGELPFDRTMKISTESRGLGAPGHRAAEQEGPRRDSGPDEASPPQARHARRGVEPPHEQGPAPAAQAPQHLRQDGDHPARPGPG